MNPYLDASRKISKIDVVGEYPIGKDREDKLEAAIREHYQVDFFMMLYQLEGNRTAFEIREIAGEKAVVLQAQIGRQQSELLDPSIAATIAMERAAGRFPDIPDIILERGDELIFDYIGPLAQLQKRHHRSVNTQQFFQDAAMILKLNPAAGDLIDTDRMMKEAMENNRIDAERTKEFVVQIRKTRAQEQQAVAGREQIKELSESAENLKDPGAQQAFTALAGTV